MSKKTKRIPITLQILLNIVSKLQDNHQEQIKQRTDIKHMDGLKSVEILLDELDDVEQEVDQHDGVHNQTKVYFLTIIKF